MRRPRHPEALVRVEWDWQGVRYAFGLAPNGQLFANPPVNVRVQRVYDSLACDNERHPAVTLIDRFARACSGVYVASDGSRSEKEYLAYRTADGEYVRIITNFGPWIARAQERHRQRTGELAGLPLALPVALSEVRDFLFYMPQNDPETIILRIAANRHAIAQSWRVTGDDSPQLVTPPKNGSDTFARTARAAR